MPVRVQLLSDLHLEAYRDSGAAFIAALDPSGVDVLVLAGDIGNARSIGKNLSDICARYSEATVLFVMGNHELYGGAPKLVEDLVRHIERRTPNLRVLDDGVAEVAGVVFAGTPLWFRHDPLNAAYRDGMNDFHQINGFTPWVYERNRRSEDFLRAALSVESGRSAVDVVVTHHLPSGRCISPQYVAHPLNRFFACPIADEVPHLPQVWLFGHTHDPVDLVHRGCRFLCNPHGYATQPRPAAYKSKLVFEIEHRE